MDCDNRKQDLSKANYQGFITYLTAKAAMISRWVHKEKNEWIISLCASRFLRVLCG